MELKGPPVPQRAGTPRWLYELLRRLGQDTKYLKDGISAIVRGEMPDGSGNPLIDLSQYFFKPGRPNGQLGHGGVGAGEDLTLSSTRSTEKGNIYLNAEQDISVDETNKRIGIAKAVPTARLHLAVGNPTADSYLPSSDITVPDNNTWTRRQDSIGTPSTIPTYFGNIITDDGYSSYVTSGNTGGVTVGSWPLEMGTPVLDSGTQQWRITYTARRLFGVPIFGTHEFVLKLSNGDSISGTPVDNSTMTDAWVEYTYDVTTLSGTGGATNRIVLTNTWPGYVGPDHYYFAVSYISISPLAGGDSAEPLQKWENDDFVETLAYSMDGSGEADGFDLNLSGEAPLMITAGDASSGLRLLSEDNNARIEAGAADQTNKNLVLSGNRDATGTELTSKFSNTRLTGTIEINGGGPLAGDVLTAVDTDGLGTWSAPSALATRVQHDWRANGPYRVDTSVDGGWTAPSAMSITAVWVYRTTAGTASSTILDLHKNGVTMYTTQANRPTIAFNDGDNKVLATLPDIVSVAAGDVLTMDIDQIEDGSPRHVTLLLEGA